MLHLAPGTTLRDYEIQSVLGKGGFAITYLALDKNLSKRVVLKELLPDGIATRVDGITVVTQTPDQADDFQWAVASFLQEAKTLASFEHPNIVRISRLFEDHGTAYIVMPFIEGRTLKQIIKEEAPLPYERVAKILDAMLNGMEVVHANDVLHRDIKPDNIFITHEGVPVLIDFGAARQQVSGRSMDMTSIITPGYAPIEQYSTDSKFQGAWSDIYAIAAVTYEMITKIKPASASDRNDSLRHQHPDPVKPLHQVVNGSYPPAFLHGIDRALSLGEKQRPQNIAEWRQLLGLGHSGTPQPPAQPQPPVSQPQPPIRPPQDPTSFQPPGNSVRTKPKPKPSGRKKTAIIALFLLLLCGAALAFLISHGSGDSKETAGDDNQEEKKGEGGGGGGNGGDDPPPPTKEISFTPEFTFEGEDVPTTSFSLLEDYLHSEVIPIGKAMTIEDRKVTLEVPYDTKFPLFMTLEIPHMKLIMFDLKEDVAPRWNLEFKPTTRSITASLHPEVKGTTITFGTDSVQDPALGNLLASMAPSKIDWQTKEEQENERLRFAEIPNLPCTIQVDAFSEDWKRSLRKDVRYLVLGGSPPSLALEARRNSAETGDLASIQKLAQKHQDQDRFFDSFSWFYFAARLGRQEAQHNVALYFEGGVDDEAKLIIKPDQGLAQKWYEASAAQDYAPAYYALGRRWHHGFTMTYLVKPRIRETKTFKDPDKAIDWYKKAYAKKFHRGTRGWAGVLYEQAVDENTGEVKDARKLQEAIELLLEAGHGNDAWSFFDLGIIYYNKADKEKAIEYFEQAVAKAKQIGDKGCEDAAKAELKDLGK